MSVIIKRPISDTVPPEIIPTKMSLPKPGQYIPPKTIQPTTPPPPSSPPATSKEVQPTQISFPPAIPNPTQEQINQVINLGLQYFQMQFPIYQQAILNLYRQVYPQYYNIQKPSLTYMISGSGLSTRIDVYISALGISSGYLAGYNFGEGIAYAWVYENNPKGYVDSVLSTLYFDAYTRFDIPVVKITPPSYQESLPFTFSPPPPPPNISGISVKVVDLVGNEISGALVTLSSPTLGTYKGFSKVSLLVAPSGTYTISISKDNYGTFTDVIFLYPGLLHDMTVAIAQVAPPPSPPPPKVAPPTAPPPTPTAPPPPPTQTPQATIFDFISYLLNLPFQILQEFLKQFSSG